MALLIEEMRRSCHDETKRVCSLHCMAHATSSDCYVPSSLVLLQLSQCALRKQTKKVIARSVNRALAVGFHTWKSKIMQLIKAELSYIQGNFQEAQWREGDHKRQVAAAVAAQSKAEAEAARLAAAAGGDWAAALGAQHAALNALREELQNLQVEMAAQQAAFVSAATAAGVDLRKQRREKALGLQHPSRRSTSNGEALVGANLKKQEALEESAQSLEEVVTGEHNPLMMQRFIEERSAETMALRRELAEWRRRARAAAAAAGRAERTALARGARRRRLAAAAAGLAGALEDRDRRLHQLVKEHLEGNHGGQRAPPGGHRQKHSKRSERRKAALGFLLDTLRELQTEVRNLKSSRVARMLGDERPAAQEEEKGAPPGGGGGGGGGGGPPPLGGPGGAGAGGEQRRLEAQVRALEHQVRSYRGLGGARAVAEVRGALAAALLRQRDGRAVSEPEEGGRRG